VLRERGADEALLPLGVVKPAHLERDQPCLAEIDRLLEAALGEVPEVNPLPVPPLAHVLEVEPGLVRVRLTELGRDENVLAWLVPEVVVERWALAAVLPAALDLERLRVEHGEPAGAVPVGIAEHADHDVVAGHAMHGVGARVAGLCDQLLRLDHFLDPRAPRVVGDVHDVDPRRAEPGHDQVRPVGAVAGRAAPVPTVVVKLVTDIRHRRLVDDPPALGIDDSEEVGGLDPCPLVEARHIQELLGWRPGRLRGRSVERVRRTPRHGSSYDLVIRLSHITNEDGPCQGCVASPAR